MPLNREQLIKAMSSTVTKVTAEQQNELDKAMLQLFDEGIISATLDDQNDLIISFTSLCN